MRRSLIKHPVLIAQAYAFSLAAAGEGDMKIWQQFEISSFKFSLA
jgi:hypothetical protein